MLSCHNKLITGNEVIIAKEVIIVKEVISFDVSPVALFFLLYKYYDAPGTGPKC